MGFWVGDGQILTSFKSIDGAASLRISLSSGTQIKTDLAIAWNRWQDWALLKVDAAPKAFLKRGDNGAANVGDHCVFLELGPVGSKLTDGTVTGTNSFPRAGARLLVASGVSPESIGGALLDEFGNYVGIIGGSIVPSANPIRILALLSESGASFVSLDWETTGLAAPQSLLSDLPSNAPPTSLAELATAESSLRWSSSPIPFSTCPSLARLVRIPAAFHFHETQNRFFRGVTPGLLST